MIARLGGARFILWSALALPLVVIASLAPAPGNWMSGPDARVSDVTITATAEWHPIRSEWTLTQPRATLEDSRFLNLEAFFQNTFWLTSPTRDVVFTLRDERGNTLQTVEQSTGRAGPLPETVDFTIVFRKVPPGSYVVDARVLDEAGDVIAQNDTHLTIAPTSTS